MPNTVAVCFAKTPGITPAKTRLARDIGTDTCDILYGLMVARCRELMLELTDFNPHVAVNERAALGSPHWLNLATYAQVEGALGAKLAHAEEHFFANFQQIIFWGTDSPALTVAHFELVRAQLAVASAAIVPAIDGGFAVYGASEKLPAGSWTKIHYSTSSTCRELISVLRPGVFLAPFISDLDTIEDIPSVLQQMEAVPSQGLAWDELQAFLKKL